MDKVVHLEIPVDDARAKEFSNRPVVGSWETF